MSLATGEDYVLRPVARGWCRYESLVDGTLSLADVALMNDAISVQDENSARIEDNLRQRTGRR